MLLKRKRLEVFVIFLLLVFLTECLTIFINQHGVYDIYREDAVRVPWELPLKYIIPIWTGLFVLIGASGALLWLKPPSQVRSLAVRIWAFQLFLNILWPFCFFYIPLPVLPPILITLSFITTILLMFYSYLVTPWSAILLFPYLLMVIYKLIFHWMLYILNLNIL